jgi:CCR4-NOT transcription complex subunit 3
MENPKQKSPDFEKGKYKFFDKETGWIERKKSDFTFKYQYLENEVV